MKPQLVIIFVEFLECEKKKAPKHVVIWLHFWYRDHCLCEKKTKKKKKDFHLDSLGEMFMLTQKKFVYLFI
jgi:hypothetical protein